MNIHILHIEDKKEWNKYLSHFEKQYQHIHYTAEYHQLIENNGDGKAELFVYEDNQGEIFFYPYIINEITKIGKVVLSNKLFDIQSVFGYTGPLLSKDDNGFKNKALREFLTYCNEKKIVSEFIRFNPILRNDLFFDEIYGLKKFKLKRYVIVELKNSSKELLSGYKSRMRNYIRQAQIYDDLILTTNSDKGIIYDFFSLYKKYMKEIKADNYYLFSDKYYYYLFELIKKNGLLFYAKEDKNIVAGSLFLFFNNTVYYHHGCRDINSKISNLLNKLIFHRAFEKFGEMNYTFCLLGGGNSNDDNDSLLRFKKSFSKKEKFFYLGKRIYNNEIYKELCKIWESEFPHLTEKYKNYIEKYRFMK